MLCPKCHNRIVKGSSFCHICGEPIPQQKVEKTILSRVKQKEEIKKEKSKKRKYIAIIIFLIIVIAFIAGIYLFFNMNEPSYSSDNIVSQHVEKALHIDKDKVTLEIGETTTIKANLKCTYTVQDASICKIDQEGTITALAAGKTKVFCVSESGKKETVKVTVNKKVEETVDEEDYVFPHSDTELLTEEDLQGKDQQQLRMGINEIYARHHCTFKTEEVKNYFEAKKWYSGDENLTSDLMNGHMSEYFNEVELKNISFIQAHR